MFGNITSPVGVRMLRFPGIDIAIASLVPTLSLIERCQRLPLPQLLVMGCTVSTRTVSIRATRKVATYSSAAQGFQGTLLVPLSRMAGAPTAG
jgi:hypothetical protein